MRPILIILLKIATASNSHSWILLACSNFPTVFLFLPPYNTLQNVLNCCAYCLFFPLDLLLPNQFSKANLLTLGLWLRKVQRLLQPPSKESRQTANAQKPQTPWWIQGSVFKGEVKERVAECVTNSTQFSALRGGSRVVSQVHIISPQAPVVWGICAYGHQAT